MAPTSACLSPVSCHYGYRWNIQKNLGGPGPRPYPFQMVVLLVLTKASLQPAGPFLGDGAPQLDSLFFVLAALPILLKSVLISYLVANVWEENVMLC